ncbi:MAG: hypothetical protein GYA24_21780 [Candidatus Lokiarchaeota archaeon]|nr:hypothetical protein [Candidatus Lokiarchaeota archaeon]
MTDVEHVIFREEKIPVIDGRLDLSLKRFKSLEEIEGLKTLGQITSLSLYGTRYSNLAELISYENLKTIQGFRIPYIFKSFSK